MDSDPSCPQTRKSLTPFQGTELKPSSNWTKAIPKDFVEVATKLNYFEPYTSFLIDLMIILDANYYFEKSGRILGNT